MQFYVFCVFVIFYSATLLQNGFMGIARLSTTDYTSYHEFLSLMIDEIRSYIHSLLTIPASSLSRSQN